MKRTLLSLAIVAAAFNQSAAQNNLWPKVSEVTKPWLRWWWMGNAVDEKNIDIQLQQYAQSGFGGVEITPIYGAKGYEEKYIDFLSPKWMNMLDFTVTTAAKYKMKVDLNAGTGWPFGGPQITPQDAASKMIVQEYDVLAGRSLSLDIAVQDSIQAAMGASLKALTAFSDKGDRLNLLNKAVNGKLDWQAPTGKGNWKIYAVFSGFTRQKVKRAAPGGEGYTMDHFSATAFHHYLDRFDKAFGNKGHGIRSFFNDSYEVYGADFTPAFFTEFEQRRGYDLKLYLPELFAQTQTDSTARIRMDYRQTMAELVYENFSTVWYDWVHHYNGLSRNQAHGFPGNVIDIYARVDIPEPEMFGIIKFTIKGYNYYTTDYNNHADPDPVMIKLASSAAHFLGKPLVSCEIFTWLGEHFKVPLSHGKPEAQQAFLAGVNHVIYHGATYSPQEAAWPGWLFYASTNFAPSNTWWPHVNGLNEYITRCQSILQKGYTDNDVVIYWPYSDAQYHFGNKPLFQVEINSIDKWLIPTPFYKVSNQLTGDGYTVDYISDKYIKDAQVDNGIIKVSAEGTHYKTLVVPRTEFMPVATMQGILALAEKGATVIMQSLPEHVPGLQGIAAEQSSLKELTSSIKWNEVAGGMRSVNLGKGKLILSEDVKTALTYAKIRREQFAAQGLGFIRKVIDGDTYYYIVNHTANDIDQMLALNTQGKYAVLLDPQTGMGGTIRRQGVSSRLQLQSGDALFVKITDKKPAVSDWKYAEKQLPAIALNPQWKLEFVKGGPVLPESRLLNKLISWTALDSAASNFSGTAVYTADVDIRLDNKATEYLLVLGDVRESARVWINGQDAGIAWHPPYHLNVGTFLKNGRNNIKIEVVNLMANRIIDLDKKRVQWRNYHEINFVNIQYKEFDASSWKPQPSGLLGDVNIVPLVMSK